MKKRAGWVWSLVALSLAACGPSPIRLVGSARTPAAEGSMTVRATSNGNTRIVLDVEHMAPPDHIKADARVYVVWARPLAGDGTPQNLGALVVDKELRGRIDTLTPLRRFELFVTVEPIATAKAPSGDHLLSATVDHGP
jgi:hypothetical protein